MRAAFFALSLLVSCGLPTPEASVSAAVEAATRPVEVATNPGADIVWFEGACDASAAVLVDGLVVVADDESNILRAYTASGGPPVAVSADLSSALGATPKGAGFREFDLEGAADMDGRVALIGSHGANKKGKARPGRRRLAVTKISVVEETVQVEVLQRIDGLVDALVASGDPTTGEFGLGEAARRAPKTDRGLNIEGLAKGLDGALIVGFRGPVVGGKALVVRLNSDLTPDSATALDLGGLGIRSMERVGDAWLIVAGPHTSGAAFGLFRWTGDTPLPLPMTLPKDFNPEALIALDDEILLLSDDGTRDVGGVDCKKAPPKQRAFRGLRVPAP